ncbi:beta-galactosidase [Granulicella aggregans]
MGGSKFVEPITGAANERFLRNLEAFLAAAHRHNIAVNFTFFAFTPRVSEPRRSANDAESTPANPYLDPAAIEAEEGYIASVVERFGKVPWLSYDLINEPSFSNPRNIFHGNIPNGDPVELSAWHDWLQKRYTKLSALANAWRTTDVQLGSWQSIPLPKPADLVYDRYGNDQQVRALDYNLFAQDMFSHWVRTMVDVIHGSGSSQLIDVGQDEGGVTKRLLNQFYATSGVSFTTNHTYWQDDALLWDSVVAKRPGMPNITGETGYQPAWNPDGTWRYDELTGSAIEERKWVLGFAAGSSGAMQWDWAREPDFGVQRSDGSAKSWEFMMRDLGAFATAAAPYATGLISPEVAIVLPQSYQLSTRNSEALQAQQTAVRVLFQYNRVEAYAVGEYQIETLGKPKLILLPSPYGLSENAWKVIEARVREGATLLVSGPFSADEHLHPLDRASGVGIQSTVVPLQQRHNTLHTSFGDLALEYDGLATTLLDRATLPGGKNFQEFPLDKGRIIFSALPLELNSDLASIAPVYDRALKAAGVQETYTTDVTNPGILICPTRLPHATLYALTSETEDSAVSFTDKRSGKVIAGRLGAGKAALLLVGEHGELLATYHWAQEVAAPGTGARARVSDLEKPAK